MRTGGDLSLDHYLPLGLLIEGTPVEIMNMVLGLSNLRLLPPRENAEKVKLDKILITKIRNLIQQHVPLAQLLAVLPAMPAMR